MATATHLQLCMPAVLFRREELWQLLVHSVGFGEASSSSLHCAMSFKLHCEVMLLTVCIFCITLPASSNRIRRTKAVPSIAKQSSDIGSLHDDECVSMRQCELRCFSYVAHNAHGISAYSGSYGKDSVVEARLAQDLFICRQGCCMRSATPYHTCATKCRQLSILETHKTRFHDFTLCTQGCVYRCDVDNIKTDTAPVEGKCDGSGTPVLDKITVDDLSEMERIHLGSTKFPSAVGLMPSAKVQSLIEQTSRKIVGHKKTFNLLRSQLAQKLSATATQHVTTKEVHTSPKIIAPKPAQDSPARFLETTRRVANRMHVSASQKMAMDQAAEARTGLFLGNGVRAPPGAMQLINGRMGFVPIAQQHQDLQRFASVTAQQATTTGYAQAILPPTSPPPPAMIDQPSGQLDVVLQQYGGMPRL